MNSKPYQSELTCSRAHTQRFSGSASAPLIISDEDVAIENLMSIEGLCGVGPSFSGHRLINLSGVNEC